MSLWYETCLFSLSYSFYLTGSALINLTLGFRLQNKHQCLAQGLAFLYNNLRLCESSQVQFCYHTYYSTFSCLLLGGFMCCVFFFSLYLFFLPWCMLLLLFVDKNKRRNISMPIEVAKVVHTICRKKHVILVWTFLTRIWSSIRCPRIYSGEVDNRWHDLNLIS